MAAFEIGCRMRAIVGGDGAEGRDSARPLVLSAERRRAAAKASSSLSRSETPEEEADAVAAGRTGNVGAGIREQGGRRLPAGEHGVALAEVGEDRGRSFGVERRPASSARSAAGGACKPARAPGGVARPAGVRRALDRVTGEFQGARAQGSGSAAPIGWRGIPAGDRRAAVLRAGRKTAGVPLFSKPVPARRGGGNDPAHARGRESRRSRRADGPARLDPGAIHLRG